ncbi:MAG: FMN-binding protein [Candidatus Lernaella stagnicola]|nr:FMN-binding protein [Candidatus Lernaella stagnicola]
MSAKKKGFTKTRAFSAVYMFAISSLFAGVLSVLAVTTNPIVETNKKLATNRSIVGVFDLTGISDATSNAELEKVIAEQIRSLWVVEEDGKLRLTTTPPGPQATVFKRVWAVVDKSGTPTAYSFVVGGKGFWGPVEGLISVEPDGKTIRSVVWTKHSETPGLGARIEEDQYRAKFRGKLATPEFKVVPDGTMGQDPHKLDAITGASQTTVAGLGVFLPRDFAQWRRVFPLLREHFDDSPATAADADQQG